MKKFFDIVYAEDCDVFFNLVPKDNGQLYFRRLFVDYCHFEAANITTVSARVNALEK